MISSCSKNAKTRSLVQKTQSATYERYKLFNGSQETGETLEFFLSTLTKQAARAELGNLKDDLVRDPIISKMKNAVLKEMNLKHFYRTRS